MNGPLKVIFQDDYIMVVDKPAGLIVTPTETDSTKTLADILITDYGITLNRGGIVHRLDKDTSGVLVVGKTKEAVENLQAQFQDRTIKKEYICLVHGLLEKKGKVVGGIARNPGNREKFMVSLDGKEAETEYEPIQLLGFRVEGIDELFSDLTKPALRKLQAMRYFDYTLVKCQPLTGRTHQIRVHLKYIGNPLVGDSKYGGRRVSRLDLRWCPRQFLHAGKIEFVHPKLGKAMKFESPLPEDLLGALKFLKVVQNSNVQ